MNKQKIDLMSFNPDNIKPSGFIDERHTELIKDQLKTLHRYAYELIKISRESPDLPQVFITTISNFENALIYHIESVEEVLNMSPEDIARQKGKVKNEIDKFYNSSLGLTIGGSQNGPSVLEIYCSVSAYASKSHLDLSIKREEFKVNTLLTQGNDILNKLQNDSESANAILGELQKKASQETVSDYAKVFKSSADIHRNHSRYWLIAGIMMSVIFIVYVFTDAVYRFFPTEIIDPNTNELIRYDLTNLASKILVIAILVFFVSFSFKQYNVNRHLQTLNRHRQHALNSYILFSQSISGDDISSRNALMIHVARAIYEHNQSTGFLSEKGQQLNSGILELTKIIGDSKPT